MRTADACEAADVVAIDCERPPTYPEVQFDHHSLSRLDVDHESRRRFSHRQLLARSEHSTFLGTPLPVAFALVPQFMARQAPPRSKAGVFLMQERFAPAVVEMLRTRSLAFSCPYQQPNAPPAGTLIQRSEVRYYCRIHPRTGQPDQKLPDTFDRMIISVDCAFKDI